MHRYCARVPTLTRTSTRSNTFPRCFQRWLTAHPIRGNVPISVPEATIKRLEASQTQTPVSDQSSTVPLSIARQWHERPGCNKHGGGGGGGGGGGCIRDGLSTHHRFESQNRKTWPHSSCSTRPCYSLLHRSKGAASWHQMCWAGAGMLITSWCQRSMQPARNSTVGRKLQYYADKLVY
jgi:hypothetical protein